jgi:hypothetical protein
LKTSGTLQAKEGRKGTRGEEDRETWHGGRGMLRQCSGIAKLGLQKLLQKVREESVKGVRGRWQRASNITLKSLNLMLRAPAGYFRKNTLEGQPRKQGGSGDQEQKVSARG